MLSFFKKTEKQLNQRNVSGDTAIPMLTEGASSEHKEDTAIAYTHEVRSITNDSYGGEGGDGGDGGGE